MVLQTKVGRSKQLRHYYECPNHKLKSCSTKSINADYLENVVLDIVVDTLAKVDLSDEFEEYKKNRIECLNNSLKNNNRNISKYKKIFDSLVIKSCEVKNELLLVEINRRMEEMSKQILDCELKIEIIESKIQHLKGMTELKDITKEALLRNREAARDLVKNIIRIIEVDEDSDSIRIVTY